VDHHPASVEGAGFELGTLEGNVREDCGFEDVRVVGADAEAEVGGVGKFQGEGPDGGPGDDGDLIALTFEPEAERAFGGGADLGGGAAFDGAVLERCKAVAMDGDVGVDRVGIEILAEHEHRLPMSVDTRADKADIGLQGGIAGDATPEEMKGVLGAPDVGSASGDVVLGRDRLVEGGPGFRGEPEVAVGVEEAVLSGERPTQSEDERGKFRGVH